MTIPEIRRLFDYHLLGGIQQMERDCGHVKNLPVRKVLWHRFLGILHAGGLINDRQSTLQYVTPELANSARRSIDEVMNTPARAKPVIIAFWNEQSPNTAHGESVGSPVVLIHAPDFDHAEDLMEQCEASSMIVASDTTLEHMGSLFERAGIPVLTSAELTSGKQAMVEGMTTHIQTELYRGRANNPAMDGGYER
jgi:hypothetical protein